MKTFSEVLIRAYRDTPDKICIHLVQPGFDDKPISYRELLDGAAVFCFELQKRNIQPGEVVILILEHGLDLIHAYFGTILHGAIPSIMPFLTEKLLPERYRADLSALVGITQPAAIITYPQFEPEVQAALKPGDSVRAVINTAQIAAPEVMPDLSRMGGMQRSGTDIVLLQHSSGTTGLQKGVALSHLAVFNQLEAYSKTLGLRSEDVIVSWLPLYHDMGLIAGFLMPVLLGVPLVLMSPFDWIRAPYKMMQAVSKYRGTLSWLPNFAYNFCANKIRDRHLTGVDLSSWRAISNCSEPMRYDSHQVFYEKFKAYGLRWETLATCYAMAENVFAVTQGGIAAAVTVDEVDRDSMQVEKIARKRWGDRPFVRMLSAGRPIENVEVRVLDDNRNDLGERFIGEIALKSNCMLSEYYHRPDETSKAFLDGFYLTGDFGYIADGEVYITGRKKDIIIVGGKNVYPQDLEALAMTVPGVHPGRVSAFGVYDESSGTEEVVIVAEVEIDDPAEREAVDQGVREAINRGSAISLRQVYLVHPHWMVKTSSGKVARLANREKFLAETTAPAS